MVFVVRQFFNLCFDLLYSIFEVEGLLFVVLSLFFIGKEDIFVKFYFGPFFVLPVDIELIVFLVLFFYDFSTVNKALFKNL